MMKKLMRLMPLTLITSPLLGLTSDELSGDWCGKLEMGTTSLSLNLHITKDLEGSMKCIEQGATIPLDQVSFDGTHFTFKIDAVAASYEGILEEDTITGTFSQGIKIPLQLKRGTLEGSEWARPQEEKALQSTHLTEEICVKNGEISLAGTFVAPQGKETYPTILLLPGSGPLDRDESMGSHKPFLVIAHYLADHGIASLRLDKRGVGQSQGDFSKATYRDFISDYLAAVSFLKTEKGATTIGVMGHSEGAMLAPEISTTSPDVDFMILLAGPGTSGLNVLIKQNALILGVGNLEQEAIDQHLELMKTTCQLSKENVSREQLGEMITKKLPDLHPQIQQNWEKFDAILGMLTAPWFQSFLVYDPSSLPV